MKDTLQQFGLSEDETKVYLTGLNLGPQPASVIAKHISLKRGHTYNILEELRKKGFLSRTKKAELWYFEMLDPNKLSQLIIKKRRDLDLLDNDLKVLIPNLLNLRSPVPSQVQVQYFEGKDGYFTVADNLLSAHDELWGVYNLEETIGIAGIKYDQEYFIPERVKRGIFFRNLVFQGEYISTFIHTDKDQLRETRFLPEKFSFSSGLYVYNDEVAIITNAEPFLGLIIKSQSINEMMRQIFLFMWERAEKPKPMYRRNK